MCGENGSVVVIAIDGTGYGENGGSFGANKLKDGFLSCQLLDEHNIESSKGGREVVWI